MVQYPPPEPVPLLLLSLVEAPHTARYNDCVSYSGCESRHQFHSPSGRADSLYVTDQVAMHLFFFFNDTATTEIYTLSLHYALFFLKEAPTPELHSLSKHVSLLI